jgi:hypothetical protein
MYKFEIGQIVRAEDARLYKVEDTAVLPDGRNIYLLKELFPRYKYNCEENLEAFNGTVFNEIELRPW